MSRILVIGGTGFTGTNLVTAAIIRGHQVTAVSRHAPDNPAGEVTYLTRNAAELGDVIVASDVVIGALSPRAGSEGTLVETYATVAQQAAGANARLVIVGGFSSLRPAPGAPRFADSGQIPDEFAAEAIEVNNVRAWLDNHAPTELDWLFVSPAGEYGSYLPQGEPRGTYRTSTDTALFDEQGKSVISGADFATAVLDEIDTPAHHRTQLHYAY